MSIPAIDLMTALRSGQSTSPRLTWYGPDAERVELSGRVLDNWVAKTSNLFQDELDAEPGTRLRLDLPAHWKSVVLALAAWQLGMEVVFDAADAELVATAAPGPAAAGGSFETVMAVALPALAMRWPGSLPSGVVDYAAEIRSHGDFFMPHVDPEPERPAVRDAAGTVHTHGALLAGFAAAGDAGAAGGAPKEGPRLLVRADDGLEPVLAQALGAWAADGSVVLVHPEVAVTERLLGDERVSRS
ncbi:TIGR03089 family protein [Arthrobacter sp. UKPF54-2]|uniref:TIGR03089 family protein n=1 Tax=Arthrobacter sp. UKPF54-2 TaxID=2600159 RepID=UPI0011B18D29|nr:TIGR03089 family protein [Arthrobacter sp. UKPF54-2]QDY88938.1 TIGR03089 family protein [Arthrobacter sp. UKPF54-2]